MPAEKLAPAKKLAKKLDGQAPSILLRILPSTLTIASVCLGLTAIRISIAGDIENGIRLLALAALLDLLDGPLARYLKVEGGFGEVLDSLADAISFGVGPALLVFYWALEGQVLGWSACLFYASCCCLRLARYNSSHDADEPASNSGAQALPEGFFSGLPSPGGAGCVLLPAMIVLATSNADSVLFFPEIARSLSNSTFLVVWTILIGGLMISPIPIISFRRLFSVPAAWRPLMMIFALGMIIGFIESFFASLGCLVILYVLGQPIGAAQLARWRQTANKKARKSKSSNKLKKS